MSKLLEVFGKAITVNTADLIWYWLRAKLGNAGDDSYEFESNERENIECVLDALSNMDIEQAEILIKKFLVQDPENVYARMLSAAVFLHKNMLREALKQLQSVYLRQPNNTMALYAIGMCYERLGHEPEASEFYQDCVKFKSYLQLPRQRLAALALKNGNINKSIEQYIKITSEYPEDVSSLIVLGHLHLANHDYDVATDVFNTAILMHPDNFQSDNEHDDIMLLINESQYDQALEQVRFLLETLGEMPDIYIKQGDVYAAMNAFPQAIASYKQAIRIQPNYMEAFVKLGTLHLKCQHYTYAAESFNRAVELNDEVIDAYIGLAESQALSGNQGMALETISLAESIQQNSIILFAETASLNYQSALCEGFFDCDIQNQEQLKNLVLEAHRDHAINGEASADAYYKYGMLLMANNYIDDAILTFEKALEINPTHHRARTKLAICCYQVGEDQSAISKIIEPDILDSKMLELHYSTALLFADRKKFALAVESLNKYVNANFSESDAITSIQVVLENIGLVDRASTSWERLCFTTHNFLASS